MTPSPDTLTNLLQTIRPDVGASRISVRDVLSHIGGRSFAAVILTLALVLVSPVSGIPGTPTLGAVIIFLVSVQALIGHDHLWLPQVIMGRSISADRMSRAVDWLGRPAGWVDRHTRVRLPLLTTAPFRLGTYVVALLMAASWPLMEILPFVTSLSAGAMSLMMFGLMTRDGVYLIAGYALGAGLYATLLSVALDLM
ncbi:MAG: exopolysaccharide biosynthesis protein [Pelagimonas sp.]|jgi:hypothetical protein|nr:exopolysaccharide biosynthesis protein [Pelagimonas sp.]